MPVTAIAVFDGPSGPAYVQITGFLLNGKSELRACDGVPKLNKAAYDALLRVQLAGAASLERNADGVLLLAANNAKPVCIVPGNLKFDRNAEFTPAEAAEQALLQGTVVSSSIPGNDLPLFKRGVRLVFVAAPDDELAQYLVAQRANSIAGWQDFLARHAASAHEGDAKNALASLHQEAADAAFARYEKSREIPALKQAQQQAIQSNKVVAGFPAAGRLRARINQELDALLEPDRAKLEAFRKALAEQTAGYARLRAAKKHNEELLSVNPEYAPLVNLRADIAGEIRKLDAALEAAEGVAGTKGYDQAIQALGPYRAFAAEDPRIESLVTAAYSAHFTRGRELAGQHDWENAVAEFRHATEIRSDSKEASAELKDAEAQWTAARDRQAVQRAIAESRDYAENKQFIEAYDVLAELPDAQRALVAGQFESLKKDYPAAATRRAQKLQEIHVPIRGRADEDAVREAYELLNRAAALSGEPAIKLRLDLLSDKISAYYLDQAKRYLEKPLGSGMGIGWLYLNQAERFTPHLPAVKDAMAQYGPAYQLKSRLSIGVILRDQTSRRDSPGFADQLADAISTGLESSGLSVKVVRQSSEKADAVQPNFVLVGEILEHRVVKDAGLETLPSKYRTGTREVRNDAWEQANHDYEAAQQQLSAAQRALADAQAHSRKKEVIAAATDAVAAAQKQVDDSKHKLDATPQTQIQSVTEPYNYTRRNIDLKASVQLAYRITDSAGNVVEPGVTFPRNNHKTVAVVENVKPEDTEGVKNQGTEPDEVQFLADVEIQARDALVKSVREKVLALPAKVLKEARSRAGQGDVDGAAEEYVVFLNATQEALSPDRQEAAGFLREHYNVAVANQQQLAASK
ncbi:MAG TPA: hypothetical protein VI636_11125 [Candidatus Angelobacter sp.]